MGDQDLLIEIKILHRLSGSVWKSVIRLGGQRCWEQVGQGASG